MKSNPSLFIMIALFCTAIIVQGQTPVYTPNTPGDQYLFNRRSPSATSRDKIDRIPQTYFDSKMQSQVYATTFDAATKKFRVSVPGRPVMEYPQMLPALGNKQSDLRLPDLDFLHNNFHLIKDINTLSESYPSNYNSNKYPITFAVLNNISYFTANNGKHGSEFWRSDGTAEGTYMVKDINPGEASSGISDITVANGKIYFSATSADNGQEPYVSDGTALGTQQLMDIGAGTFSSNPTLFVNVNNSVFFVTSNSGWNNQLWKTDGTTNGTMLVKDLQQSSDFSYGIFQSATANGLLFFTAYSFTYGRELWRSDGTDAGTYLVKDITLDLNEIYSPMQLTAYNNKLYFSADDGTGRKLWVSDGTADGTTSAPGNNDILMQTDYISIYINQPFAIMNNVLYLAGYTLSSGSGLYKYDALNMASLALVKDLTAGTDVNFIVPIELRTVDNALYFKVISATGGYHDELWISKGKASDTKMVKSFIPGEVTVNYYNGFGTLYFIEYDAAHGNELWKSNGTEQGTLLVKDIYNGSGSSSPYNLTAVSDGKLLFSAVNPAHGAELWLTDGTASGTSIVKDINQTTTSGSYPDFLVNFNNTLLFSAGEIYHGNELWRSNGRPGGTSLVKDIIPGATSSAPFAITPLKNDAYFFTNNPTQLWKTDGTAEGISFIKDFSGNGVSYALYFSNFKLMYAAGNQVFFSIYNNTNGKSELWRSDGTGQGTYLLKSDLGTYIGYEAVVDNTIFFPIVTDTSASLWKSDGTVAGTVLIKSFQPNIFYEVDYLYPYNGEVYFNADDVNGYGLWKSDGTEGGTTFVKNLFRPGIGGYAVSGGLLYFDAEDGSFGRQLWKTDGTTAGTKMVQTTASFGSYPEDLTDVHGTLYFTAIDNSHGRELWKSDGTSEGTLLVKDITPGFEWTSFFSPTSRNALVNASGELYFTAYDQSYTSLNLWHSDGTETGTKPVKNRALKDVTWVTHLTPVGRKLYFNGYNYQYGNELYVGYIFSSPLTTNKAASEDYSKVKINNQFEVSVFPNPAGKTTSLEIKGTNENVNVTITDMTGSMKWQKVAGNSSYISLPVEKLPSGMYMVTVKSGSNIRTVKLVKE